MNKFDKLDRQWFIMSHNGTMRHLGEFNNSHEAEAEADKHKDCLFLLDWRIMNDWKCLASKVYNETLAEVSKEFQESLDEAHGHATQNQSA